MKKVDNHRSKMVMVNSQCGTGVSWDPGIKPSVNGPLVTLSLRPTVVRQGFNEDTEAWDLVPEIF